MEGREHIKQETKINLILSKLTRLNELLASIDDKAGSLIGCTCDQTEESTTPAGSLGRIIDDIETSISYASNTKNKLDEIC